MDFILGIFGGEDQNNRSFVDKLSDFFYCSEYLSQAVLEDNPEYRCIKVIRWFFCSFYKIKNNSVKKHCNTQTGQSFYCYWKHDIDLNVTYYEAHKVSNDPPTFTFKLYNCYDGFKVSGTIVPQSNNDGETVFLVTNSKVYFSPHKETYTITIPDDLLLINHPNFALKGKVCIDCSETFHSAHLEFDSCIPDGKCIVSGTLKLFTSTLATIEGCWDNKIYLTQKKKTVVLWEERNIKDSCLKRYPVSPDDVKIHRSEENLNSVPPFLVQNIHQAKGIHDNPQPDAKSPDEAQRSLTGREITSKPIRSLTDKKVTKYDSFCDWADGHCRLVYHPEQEEGKKHVSGWAMRKTKNRNVNILKKSCLGVSICSQRCTMENGGKPAISDKDHKNQQGKACPNKTCSGKLETHSCRGDCGYPVTHFWRHTEHAIFFQAKGIHGHPRPEAKSPDEAQRSGREITSKPIRSLTDEKTDVSKETERKETCVQNNSFKASKNITTQNGSLTNIWMKKK